MAGCMMMTQNMTMTYASANGTTSASRAHSAAMSCTSKNHIALILDAILLASIIILPIIILVHHFPICRIPVQRPVSLSIL